MNKKNEELFVYFYKIPNVHKNWKWFFTIGLLLIGLGGFAVACANWATEFTVVLLGFFLVGAGLLQILNGMYAKKWTGYSISLLLGLFYMIAGGLCIFKPILSAEGISLLIAALLLVGGVFRAISALRYQFDNWGWVLFNGLIAGLLGLLILAEWPESALWVIGLFVGIDLILMGAYWVRLSLAAKK